MTEDTRAGWHRLIRQEDRQRLVQQAREQEPVRGTRREIEHTWAVRLILPLTQCQWIITELEEDGIAFGGAQITDWELGSVWLPELEELNVRGLRVCQDLTFDGGGRTLRQWCDLARSSAGGLLPTIL